MSKLHESFDRPDRIEVGTSRAFGLVFATALAVISAYDAWKGSSSWRYWAGASGIFAFISLVVPSLLAPLNQLWFRFGILLAKITTPIVMALLFFGTVVPTGFVMRLISKDPLRLRWQREATSYWVERQPPGPEPDSLKRQF